MKLQNERYREKIAELERWLVCLLNGYYEGEPTSQQKVESGLQKIDELRYEKFQLKKLLIKEQVKMRQISESYV